MRIVKQLIILVCLAGFPFTLHRVEPTAVARDEPTWPAMDDGPCPTGMIGQVGAGWDYHDDTWFDASGAIIGYAPEEDECIRPVTDSSASRVHTTAAAQPATLPVTR